MKHLILFITFTALILYGFQMQKVQQRNFEAIEITYPDIALDLTEDFGTKMIHEYKTIYPKVKKGRVYES